MATTKFSDIQISDCIKLDEEIKSRFDKVASLKAKKLLKGWSQWDEIGLNQEILALDKAQLLFASGSCRNAIEYKRMTDTAQVTNANLESTDEALIPKSKNEQKIYIGLGVVVLLVSMYVLLKRKK